MKFVRPLMYCATMMLGCNLATAGMIFQDNFDTENGGVGTNNFAAFSNWNVLGSGSGGSVDLMGNGFNDLFPGNGLYVDLDGSTYIAGGLITKNSFQLEPGVTYTLSFSLAANYFADPTIKTIDVSIGTFSQSFSASGSGGFTVRSEDFTVASPMSSQLSFATAGVGNASSAYGALLDNVQLSDSTSAAVPEPSSFLLMLAGVPLLSRRIRSAFRRPA